MNKLTYEYDTYIDISNESIYTNTACTKIERYVITKDIKMGQVLR